MRERLHAGWRVIARTLLAAAAVAATVAVGVPARVLADAGHPSAIPAGFQAQSLSWTSPKHGWMLGSAPCGQATCTTVIGTADGGGTWNTLGTIRAPLSLEKASGVTEIRFADNLHGWAFEPALWATSDGGATWQRQPPPGGDLVLALAGDADAVYAVVSPCTFGRTCTLPATLWRTTPGQGSWIQVSVTLPAFEAFDFAVLAVHGVVAYLAIPAYLVGPPEPDVLDVTVDGQQWSSRPDPCVPQNNEVLSGVAPISDTRVALLCVGDPGFGKAEKRVLRSNDTGQTTRPAGTTPIEGITSQLVTAPDGTLVISSYSIESWIYRNAGGRTWTTQETENDAGQGWNDIMFTTNQVGYVIHGPVSCCGGHGPGELWKTGDGGLTWAPV